MRRTGWLKAMLLATTALAPLATAQDTNNTDETSESDSSSMQSQMSVLLDLPQCAMVCFLEMRQRSTGCENDDLECLCQSSALDAEVTQCVSAACTIKESLFARNLTSTACQFPIRDISQTYTTIAIVFSVISGVAVLQRFIAKLLAENLTLGMDDYMVLLAALVQAPMAAVGVAGGVKSGLGRDIWTLEFSQVTDFSYYLYIFTVLYFANIAVVKLAFLFFYLQVFPKRSVRRYLWGTVAFTIVFGLTFVFAGIFECRPISHYWTRWTGETEGSCVDVSVVAWANSGVSIALDLWMIAIPLSQVQHLNLDWKKKTEVAFMFCVGLFVTIMSCLRLESLVTHDAGSPNATWVKQEVAIWSTVEVNVGIICACLPSIRTLIVMAFGRIPLVGSRNRRSKHLSSDDHYNRKSKHFGTISRSIAEPVEGGRARAHPHDGIRMERTCHVEFERVSDPHSDEAHLVEAGDPRWLSSDDSIDREKERNRKMEH